MTRFIRAPRRLVAWLRTHRQALRWPRAPRTRRPAPVVEARAIQRLPPRVALAVHRSQRARARQDDLET